MSNVLHINLIMLCLGFILQSYAMDNTAPKDQSLGSTGSAQAKKSLYAGYQTPYWEQVLMHDYKITVKILVKKKESNETNKILDETNERNEAVINFLATDKKRVIDVKKALLEIVHEYTKRKKDGKVNPDLPVSCTLQCIKKESSSFSESFYIESVPAGQLFDPIEKEVCRCEGINRPYDKSNA